MRAVAIRQPGGIDELVDLDLPKPTPGPRDLRVAVRAVAMNPIDTKVRRRPLLKEGAPRILGFDAAGVVESCGPEVTLFKPGDEVFYAGVANRDGTNAELHCVDERIVGRKPKSLDFARAAALPLTALTAYESLFDRLDMRKPPAGVAPAILIVGGGGGVGSIAIQLARRLTDATVVATASRPETQAWCRELGAHHVIDHKGIAAAWRDLDLPPPPFVFSIVDTSACIKDVVEVIAPQGRIALIDDPDVFDVKLLKPKCLSLHWEMMFVRPIFGTADMIRQHEMLNEVSQLVDAGTLRTTFGEHYGRIDAANLRRAHATIESGNAKGKIVLEGF